ncbi:MAG: Rrf2 family transcriptional regulator [Pyrinomonadaceae bacterium]|nr:Rrf2 family transcriptional regulator [Pyrinomonadaceae bacterium]MCX7639585.1 Rrf2 family transcriptional regulator [Pyrinomonadaceae bacterium]MDW8303978.1 Rrf2 family transcriptional regulator [Acidobacteriota bacterium]
MKISAQEEYGLRCLVQLALLKEGETLTLTQIAEREGISVANAGKLMWLLSKAGFVKATRGTKGGYCLARPASEIKLSEVIKVLEEKGIENHCENFTGVLDICVHKEDCGIRSVIVGLHEIIRNVLSQITLAELIAPEKMVDQKFHQIQRIHRIF